MVVRMVTASLGMGFFQALRAANGVAMRRLRRLYRGHLRQEDFPVTIVK
jgi:predicted metallopeptidase